VSTVPSPHLRISDLDRESALQALGEHMSIGRINLDEYAERSGRVTAAKTRGELADIFDDLPQPHPRLDDDPVTPAEPATQSTAPTARAGHPTVWADRPLTQRLTAAAIPIAWVAGVVLFFGTGLWVWFLLPVLVTATGRGLWGAEWEHGRQRRDRDSGRQRDERRGHE
jgi:hypothetical protein